MGYSLYLYTFNFYIAFIDNSIFGIFTTMPSPYPYCYTAALAVLKSAAYLNLTN